MVDNRRSGAAGRPGRAVTAHPERRVRGLFLAILVVLTVFAAQMVRLQGFDAGGLAQKGARQRTVEAVVPAARGVITDADGTVLADSVEQYTVVADQQAVKEYTKKVNGKRQVVGAKGAAAALAPILKLDEGQVFTRLDGTKRYNRVATDVPAVAWRAISRLGVPGIASERTVKRVYPQSTATAPLLAFLNNDGKPAGGIESMLDSQLKGVNGSQQYEQTPTGRRIPTADDSYVAPVPGKQVRLTIDSDVQWFAQNALAQAVPRLKALSANVVVQDVTTGKLVAVASYPTFDPGDLTTLSTGGTLANPAFQEAFEPGSTAKVITMGAALQEGVVTPETGVTIPNRLKRSDKTFQDSHDHPELHLTATGVLAQSSNIGTILIGERMSPETYLRYVSAIGLGHPTGIGFPGETPGLIPKTVGDSQRYTVLYGQGMSVNAVQAAGVFQAIANGGKRIAPTLVEGTSDASGRFTPAQPPAENQVFSPQAARSLADMMESVVSGEGTAAAAEIPGYLVAGKTGTAKRYDAQKKAYNGYTASFIGFAPADKPRYVVAVTVQRPQTDTYGGSAAGPVFADVMKYVLEKYNVPPSGAKAADLPLTTGGTSPETGEVTATPTAGASGTSGTSGTSGASGTSQASREPSAGAAGTSASDAASPTGSAASGASATSTNSTPVPGAATTSTDQTAR